MVVITTVSHALKQYSLGMCTYRITKCDFRAGKCRCTITVGGKKLSLMPLFIG